MHPCLRVDEILRHVASETVASKGEGTVVSLTCCCKGLEDPVLDVLWEIQKWLTSLLGSLPEDVWDPREHGVVIPTISTSLLYSLNHSDPVF